MQWGENKQMKCETWGMEDDEGKRRLNTLMKRTNRRWKGECSEGNEIFLQGWTMQVNTRYFGSRLCRYKLSDVVKLIRSKSNSRATEQSDLQRDCWYLYS